ncbi:lipoprotein [Streptomyces sp. WM6386]|nr:lipoprotein [Streptomyces sp. WM6386]
MSIRGSVRRRGAGAVAAAMLLTGAVACGGGGEKNDATGTGAKTGKKRSVTQVITAAYKKTAEAKSARVNMTMSVPGADGGEMTMSGIMGWDPTLMDMTMKGSALAADADMPKNARIIWQNDVVYVDAGAAAAKEMDGKRWMKLDLGAMAEEAEKSGDDELTKELTGGLEDMNQDPAQQLAMLLDSPNLKHVGSEKIDGADTEHYKGTLTVEEMMATNKSLDVLEPKERKELLAGMKKAGIKGYDTEVWVNEDDLPVRMDVGISSPQGTVEMSMKLSDYGAKAEVEVPPANETFDLMEMFKELAGSGDLGGS